MSSTCYNVFLYAWLNDTFRKELKRILPCFPADGSDAITNAAPNNTQAGGRTEGEAKRQSIARLNNGVGVQLDTQLHHGQHQTDHHHHPRDQRRSNLIVQEVQVSIKSFLLLYCYESLPHDRPFFFCSIVGICIILSDDGEEKCQ